MNSAAVVVKYPQIHRCLFHWRRPIDSLRWVHLSLSLSCMSVFHVGSGLMTSWLDTHEIKAMVIKPGYHVQVHCKLLCWWTCSWKSPPIHLPFHSHLLAATSTQHRHARFLSTIQKLISPSFAFKCLLIIFFIGGFQMSLTLLGHFDHGNAPTPRSPLTSDSC